MDLRKDDLPATLQAFDLYDNKEIFIAEQVVNSQSEIETFTSRYAGKLIKALKVPVRDINSYSAEGYKKPPAASSTGIVMIILIVIIVALVIYGFSTGWIQEKLHIKV